MSDRSSGGSYAVNSAKSIELKMHQRGNWRGNFPWHLGLT